MMYDGNAARCDRRDLSGEAFQNRQRDTVTGAELYAAHLAESQTAEHRAASQRVLYGGASHADLIRVALWELREADASLPPNAPETRPIDAWHASACVERAASMLRQLARQLAELPVGATVVERKL